MCDRVGSDRNRPPEVGLDESAYPLRSKCPETFTGRRNLALLLVPADGPGQLLWDLTRLRIAVASPR
jgi:hypothetical protein